MRALVTVLAAVIAGAVAGAGLGLASSVVELRVRALVAGLLYLALVAGALWSVAPLLQADRETSQRLLGLGPIRWALRNGAELGLGFTSRIGFWSWYLIPIGIWVSGDWRVGVAVWGVYGASRTLVAVAVAYRGTEQLLADTTLLMGLRGQAATVTRAATAVAGLVLVALVAA